MKKLYTTAILLFAFVASLFSQSGELLLYNMERVPQSHQINPARYPIHTSGYFALPSVDLGVSLPMAYRDVIERRSNDSLYINLSRILSNMHDKNKLAIDLNSQILGFGFRANKLFFNIAINARASGNVAIEKDLVNFIVNGNSVYMGRSANLIKNGLGGGTAWTELAIGAGYDINEQWSVGIKPKLLFGVANVHTGNTNLSFYTSETGDMVRATAAIDIHTSIPESAISAFKNTGFAIDFGGVYKINKHFEVSASVVDLGFISWNQQNNTQYKNKQDQFEFVGFDWDELWDGSFNEGFINNIVDSLTNMLEIDTLKYLASYSSNLPTKVYLSGSYRINDMFKVNAVYRAQFANKRMHSTFSVNANYYSGKWFEASIGNTIIGRSIFNPGLAMHVTFGGVGQLFCAFDFSSLDVSKVKSLNAHLGINFLFGYNDSVRNSKKR